MSPAIRDRVWNWIHNPKVLEDKAEWKEIREKVIEFTMNATRIMLEFGPPENRKIQLR